MKLIDNKTNKNDCQLYMGDFNLPFLHWKEGNIIIPDSDLLSEFIFEFPERNLKQLNNVFAAIAFYN